LKDTRGNRRALLLALALVLGLWPRAGHAAEAPLLMAPELYLVQVSESVGPGGQLALTLSFPRVPQDPRLEAPITVPEARALVAALEAHFKAPKARFDLYSRVLSFLGEPSPLWPPWKPELLDLELRLREAFQHLYGPFLPGFPLPVSILSSNWFRALQLSPKYFPEGLRAAAIELFSSPTFSLSVALSLFLYGLAWISPEPVVSKAFAAAVTLALLTVYTFTELLLVGHAFYQLYHEAELARSDAALEAIAQRFANAMSGVTLRVIVSLAGARLSRALPELPPGGLSGLSPRFAYSGLGRSGFSFSSKASAKVDLMNGSVVFMGVTANTTAAAATAAQKARTTGGCAETKKDDNNNHHIATDKHGSERSGGPWTPPFQELFDLAGMSLNDPANLVYLTNHQGPHPQEYHEEVYRRLEKTLTGCKPFDECRRKLVDALDKLAADICSPGSKLNKLTTKKQ
jgi:hypothetical protein